MTEFATSPRHHHPPVTPSSRSCAKSPPNTNMPPFCNPRVSTPQHQQPTKGASTPSPNYFGFQDGTGSGTFLSDTPHHAKQNWSPPSSAVRSTAAASPSVVPVDQNPDFDAFRRQSEGKAFNLGGLSANFKMTVPPAMKSKHDRSGSKTSADSKSSETSGGSAKDEAGATQPRQVSNQSLDPSTAELLRSPKRVLSPGSAAMPELARRGSPASFMNGEPERPQSQPRFQLPLDNTNGHLGVAKVHRAETLPEPRVGETEPSMVTAQHVLNLMESKLESILLLDLRVSTQHAKSHIIGALNLCIPTTLLKRPSFNVQKLADTFKDTEQKRRFEAWRTSRYIIVYDASSSDLRDAGVCLNTIKKFKSEGCAGQLYILKGGFGEFSKRFSAYLASGENGVVNGQAVTDTNTNGPYTVPVIGGCPMPATDNAANPFFGNIRQNMDLIGGVGQIPLKHPAKASPSVEAGKYPEWLQRAADDGDQGKKVSNKFEAIERREKKRMEDALSGKVAFGSPRAQQSQGDKQVRIAGIENGAKNRYNNIWPFEHSRVKLQGVKSDGCDYFNASFLKAAWSHKRYISTQAPIPATFNDFWNVVWQRDVRVIVMLTAEREGAQVKAHNYWDQKQYGPLHLDFLSEKRASLELDRIHKHHAKSAEKHKQQRPSAVNRHSLSTGQVPLAQLDTKEEKAVISGTGEQPYVIVRKFTLSHEKYPFEPMHEITQLQYSSWPDFGAPAHPAHLLGLVEQTDAVVRATNKSHHSKEPEPPNERPVMVHCSAGCGRTGTFCTVDSVIDMLKRQRMSSRQGREKRDATPMEVDSKAPPLRTPRTPHGERKSAKAGGADDDGFFAVKQPQVSSPTDSGPEGSWIKRDDLDLVEKTVEDFRHQRLSMVQSLRQYVLCYESVMEWLVEQSAEEKI